jgi:hypothetical protein
MVATQICRRPIEEKNQVETDGWMDGWIGGAIQSNRAATNLGMGMDGAGHGGREMLERARGGIGDLT